MCLVTVEEDTETVGLCLIVDFGIAFSDISADQALDGKVVGDILFSVAGGGALLHVDDQFDFLNTGGNAEVGVGSEDLGIELPVACEICNRNLRDLDLGAVLELEFIRTHCAGFILGPGNLSGSLAVAEECALEVALVTGDNVAAAGIVIGPHINIVDIQHGNIACRFLAVCRSGGQDIIAGSVGDEVHLVSGGTCNVVNLAFNLGLVLVEFDEFDRCRIVGGPGNALVRSVERRYIRLDAFPFQLALEHFHAGPVQFNLGFYHTADSDFHRVAESPCFLFEGIGNYNPGLAFLEALYKACGCGGDSFIPADPAEG